MTTLVVLQPSYLPWIGFLDLVRRCDVFVFYDDVQFDKHGWRNRNRIKTANGPAWLTVPVRHKGRMGQKINEVEIETSTPWARKHLQTIEQAYARAPFLHQYMMPLSNLLMRPWAKLVDLDIALSVQMCSWFGLERPMLRASELNIDGDRNSRLLGLCKHFGVDTYLSGNAAQVYLDVDAFSAAGVRVEWQEYRHPTYQQVHGPFEPYMSALDLLLNMGSGGAEII